MLDYQIVLNVLFFILSIVVSLFMFFQKRKDKVLEDDKKENKEKLLKLESEYTAYYVENKTKIDAFERGFQSAIASFASSLSSLKFEMTQAIHANQKETDVNINDMKTTILTALGDLKFFTFKEFATKEELRELKEQRDKT